MLQSEQKILVKNDFSTPHFPINKIEKPPDKHIGHGHKVNDTVIDGLGGFSIGLALYHRSAHGTLRLRHRWYDEHYEQYDEKSSLHGKLIGVIR